MSTQEPSITFKKTSGGITAASGFKAAGVKAGIKESKKLDLALLVSDTPCTAVGTFTQNAIRASSVNWCSERLPSSKIKALICNSGCANACTGDRGIEDNAALASLGGLASKVSGEYVLVASTGVIGEFLPLNNIKKVISKLSDTLSDQGGKLFSKAIMTTDLVRKESAIQIIINEKTYTIGGCCKGSGMIHPNMATMLAFISSDVKITPAKLNPILKRTVERTFNNLTVDGDTSTNDMVLVLANGVSGTSVSTKKELETFEEGLYIVCSDLCKMIAADGEGATKRVEIHVNGAQSEPDAKKAAKAIAGSNLIKCALFGNDPNWGRIACAVGYSGAAFSDELMTIKICNIPVFRNLQPVKFCEKEIHKKLKCPVVVIEIDLGLGEYQAIAHTCDLTYDYVKINAEYRT